VIEEQGKRLGEIEAERNDARAQLNDLRYQLDAVEADRAARLGVIYEQAQRLGESEKTRNLQQTIIETQATELNQLRQELRELQSQWPVRVLRRLKFIKGPAFPSSMSPQEDQL